MTVSHFCFLLLVSHHKFVPFQLHKLTICVMSATNGRVLSVLRRVATSASLIVRRKRKPKWRMWLSLTVGNINGSFSFPSLWDLVPSGGKDYLGTQQWVGSGFQDLVGMTWRDLVGTSE